MTQLGPDSSPPMSSDFDTTGEPPGWPKVVGIISIVLGSLGMVCGLCGAAFVIGMGPFMDKMAQLQAQGGNRGGGPQIPTTSMPAELLPGPLSIVGAVSTPITALLMLIGGIALLRRTPAGRTMHLVYAVASLIFTGIGLIGAIQYQGSTSAFFAAHPDDPWVKFFQGQGGMNNQLVQAFATTCVSVLYPGFCLVWFGMIKRRPEDMGTRLEEPVV